MVIVRRWLSTVLSGTQLVILFLVLLVSAGIVLSVGHLLAPFFFAIPLATPVRAVLKTWRPRDVVLSGQG